MATAVPAQSGEANSSNAAPVSGATGALTLLLLINLFNYVDRYVLAAVEPRIEHDFHASEAAMGTLATAFLLSYMFISPIFGWLAGRMSRWVLVGIGVIVWSLASGASGLAQTFVLLLLTRCFVGVGEAAYGPSAPAILSDLYPVKMRGKVLSWFYVAIPVGSALGYALGGQVQAHFGWRSAFYVVVPPGILLGIIALFMRERRATTVAAVEAEGDAMIASDAPPTAVVLDYGEAPKKQSIWRDYLSVLAIPSYLLDTAGMTALTFAIGGIGFWMPKYIVVYRKYGDLGHVNLVFGMITVVSGLLATLLGGVAGDRLRSRFRGSYFLVSAAGLLCGFPLLICVLYVPFPLAWVFMFFAIFCLFFNTGPSNAILANVTHPAVRASGFALNILIIHLFGDAISPPVIGWMSQKYSMNTAFLFVSMMMVVGGVLWLCGAQFLEADTARAEGRVNAVNAGGKAT